MSLFFFFVSCPCVDGTSNAPYKGFRMIENTPGAPVSCSMSVAKQAKTSFYYPGQKNRYSREIHEVDRRSDPVISCDIELRFDSDATCGSCASRARNADRSRCCEISHDRTADQSHEYLGSNDFFGQSSRSYTG